MAGARETAHLVRPPKASDRKLVDRLPQPNERLSHGEPTWSAGKGKVFAMRDVGPSGGVGAVLEHQPNWRTS